MKDFVIVIGRQFGAGGRHLGKQLAEALGVPYYDKELLAEAAGSLGYSQDIFQKADERKPSILRSFISFNFGSPSASFDNYTLNDDNLYRAQSDVIRSICKKGSCVIVGRTADYVMRDHPGLLSIFIHAPEKHRAQAVIKRGEAANEAEAIEKVRKNDRTRESYYNFYTNRHWGRASNYDLTFDSSRIPMERILSLLTDLCKK